MLFATCTDASCTEQAAWARDLRSGDARERVPDATQAWYAATGHLVYVRPGGVFCGAVRSWRTGDDRSAGAGARGGAGDPGNVS